MICFFVYRNHENAIFAYNVFFRRACHRKNKMRSSRCADLNNRFLGRLKRQGFDPAAHLFYSYLLSPPYAFLTAIASWSAQEVDLTPQVLPRSFSSIYSTV